MVKAKQHPRVGTKARTFRAALAAMQLLNDLAATHSGRKVRMLDIGGSHGVHARFFRSHGIDVDLVDMVAGDEPPIFTGDYLKFRPSTPYDVVWSSHVIEHVRNVGIFLDKMRADLAPDGYCVASVPPMRGERMAYNHISFWNPGMLLLNFGLAGFDMGSARVAQYGYNVSIIARHAKIMPDDIKDGFPRELAISGKHFNGDVKAYNWPKPSMKSILCPLDLGSASDAEIAGQMAANNARFATTQRNGKKAWHYLDGESVIPLR